MTDSFGNEIVIPPDNVCYNFMSNHLNNRSGDLVFRGSNFVLKSPNGYINENSDCYAYLMNVFNKEPSSSIDLDLIIIDSTDNNIPSVPSEQQINTTTENIPMENNPMENNDENTIYEDDGMDENEYNELPQDVKQRILKKIKSEK